MNGRRAVSLAEVLLGALILGLSGMTVLELIRSNTVALEVTEVEAAARGLAADVLERLTGPPAFPDNAVSQVEKKLQGAPLAWDVVVNDDPSLKLGFPVTELAPLLSTADVRVSLKIVRPFEHAALGKSAGMDLYTVTASWTERDDRRKEVSFARLVDRH